MRRINLVRAGVCLLVSGLALAALAAAAGVDRAAMDPSVAPGDDFWTYANGGWVKAHPIPADRSGYGISSLLIDQADKRTVDLIVEAARDAAPGSDARKIGDYYASYMDEAQIEAKGIAPLKPMLDKIAAVGDRKALATLVGQKLRADVDALNNTDR
jgi:predicted metalloendopeptidase